MSEFKTTDENILELIRKAYCYAKPDGSENVGNLTLTSSVESLGIQSVAALEMAGFIEEELDVQFADDELSSLNGMSDLASLIRKHAREAA